MPTKSRYRGAVLEFFDSTTHERVAPLAPVVFYDDFLGEDGYDIAASAADGTWNSVEVTLNTAIAIRGDTANGVLAMIIDADSNAEDATIDWANNRQFNTKAGLVFECRIDMAVLPTTGVAVVFGMNGDHNLDKDASTEHAWFRLQASGAVLAETDDTTNNNDDIATGVTAVAGTYNTYLIDFTNIADVRFYIDGASVATGTTFDMSNLTDAEGLMQPYFSLDKASGTGVGTIDLDYVRIWSQRTELALNN